MDAHADVMESSDLKSMHIAVFALSLLGGSHRKVHTEDLALKCFELAPDRFQWEKYPFADKELVRKALFHASEKKNGALVAGRAGIEKRGKSRDGWQLTPAGAAWVAANSTHLDARVPSKGAVIPKREAERILRKIRSERAYQLFSTGGISEVTSYMFTDLLNCSPDAPPDVIRTKFQRLVTNASLIGDETILSFLRSCEMQFANLVGDTDASRISDENE